MDPLSIKSCLECDAMVMVSIEGWLQMDLSSLPNSTPPAAVVERYIDGVDRVVGNPVVGLPGDMAMEA